MLLSADAPPEREVASTELSLPQHLRFPRAMKVQNAIGAWLAIEVELY
jgi:hypothetical protein